MPLNPIFDRCFAPLFGRPCWQVKPGYGSFITMEFGEPYLETRDPKTAAPDASPKVRELLARRQVTIHGEWHFWIYCCDWSILHNDRVVGCSDDNESFAVATKFLDGQALVAANTDSSASSIFTFDLGGLLTTSPYDENSEQWMLYQPDGNVLSLRANGTYCHSLSNTAQNAEKWLPAWTP